MEWIRGTKWRMTTKTAAPVSYVYGAFNKFMSRMNRKKANNFRDIRHILASRVYLSRARGCGFPYVYANQSTFSQFGAASRLNPPARQSRSCNKGSFNFLTVAPRCSCVFATYWPIARPLLRKCTHVISRLYNQIFSRTLFRNSPFICSSGNTVTRAQAIQRFYKSCSYDWANNIIEEHVIWLIMVYNRMNKLVISLIKPDCLFLSVSSNKVLWRKLYHFSFVGLMYKYHDV